MGMNFACPRCATVMLVPEKLLGSSVECPGCGCLLTTERPALAIGEIQAEEKHTREGQMTAGEADRWRKVGAGLRLISLGVYVRIGLFILLGVVYMISPTSGVGLTLGTGEAFRSGLVLRLVLLGSLGLGGLGDLFTLSTPTPARGMSRLAGVTSSCTLLVLLVSFTSVCLLILGALGLGFRDNLRVRVILEMGTLLLALAALSSFCFWLRGVSGHFRDRKIPASVSWFLLGVAGNGVLFVGSFFLVWWLGAGIDASGHLDRSTSRSLGAVAVLLLILNATCIMFLMFWFAILVSTARRILERKLRLAPGVA